MRLYLAGPMRGIRAYNHPAFDAATAQLRDEGYEVFSPAEHDRTILPNIDWQQMTGNMDTDGIKSDIRAIIKADLVWICEHAEGIALLPGWEHSKGVAVEVALGKFLEIPVAEVAEFCR